MNKSEQISFLMAKAGENLHVASRLFAEKHYEISASRSYYSMFYAAEAALLHRDLQFSKHSAVISRFNQEFVKSGVFSSASFKSLQKAYDLRTKADYGTLPLRYEEAETIASEADSFVSAVREYLEKEGYELKGIKEESNV